MDVQEPESKSTSFTKTEDPLLKAKDLYQIIYNSPPSQSDLDYLEKLLPTIPNDSNNISLFRKIVSGFDHQGHPTAFTVRFSNEDVEYVSMSGVEIAIDKSDLTVGNYLKLGMFEPWLIQFYVDRLKAGMTFVDIGANVGPYSMLAARIVGDKGRVFSFEPNSENCRLILLGAQRNEFNNITLFPVALGKESGYVQFTTHIGSNGGVIPGSQNSLINPNCIVAPMLRLDDLLHEKVDYIKIDVEGAEDLVMQGAAGLIEKYHPIITSEFSLEMLPRISGISGLDYLRFFTDRGYQVNLIERDSGTVTPIADVEMFVRDYGELTRIEDLAFYPEMEFLEVGKQQPFGDTQEQMEDQEMMDMRKEIMQLKLVVAELMLKNRALKKSLQGKEKSLDE